MNIFYTLCFFHLSSLYFPLFLSYKGSLCWLYSFFVVVEDIVEHKDSVGVVALRRGGRGEGEGEGKRSSWEKGARGERGQRPEGRKGCSCCWDLHVKSV